jgi:hypothetical protein
MPSVLFILDHKRTAGSSPNTKTGKLDFGTLISEIFFIKKFYDYKFFAFWRVDPDLEGGLL